MTHEIDPKEIRAAISETFVIKLLELFESEDPRERDYLKTLLHRIYGRFMPLREFIWKAVMNYFIRLAATSMDESNGVLELLEILCAIVNGF